MSYGGGAGVEDLRTSQHPPPIQPPKIFTKKTQPMINTLIKKAAETFNKPTVSQPISQPEPAPKPIPQPAPEPAKPTLQLTPEPTPIDQSPRAIAMRAAEAAGWKPGDIQPRAKILRHQPSKMFLLVQVDGWGEPVI